MLTVTFSFVVKNVCQQLQNELNIKHSWKTSGNRFGSFKLHTDGWAFKFQMETKKMWIEMKFIPIVLTHEQVLNHLHNKNDEMPASYKTAKAKSCLQKHFFNLCGKHLKIEVKLS